MDFNAPSKLKVVTNASPLPFGSLIGTRTYIRTYLCMYLCRISVRTSDLLAVAMLHAFQRLPQARVFTHDQHPFELSMHDSSGPLDSFDIVVEEGAEDGEMLSQSEDQRETFHDQGMA